MLTRNLAALETHDHGLAEAIRAAVSVPSAPYGLDPVKLASVVDPTKDGAALVLGFGDGRLIHEVMRRMARGGFVFVYEPDLGHVRWVLERADHSGWLFAPNCAVLTAADQIRPALRGLETRLAEGVGVVEHPVDAERLGDRAAVFLEAFVLGYKAVRSNATTAMLMGPTLIRNTLANLGRYVVGNRGLRGLANHAAKRPAVCVAAGPSFARDVRALQTAGLRDNFVLVSTQTTLKPLLRHGIRPHFVCALDWSDLSRRFYEGLTAADVAGIELVCTVEVNPVVPASWPGALRMAGEPAADEMAGEPLSDRYGCLPRTATVGAMGHVLARYMGCDPVIHVGLDLAFTDGVYYGPGAAIHQAWAGEVGPFRTLEMLEHERVMRGRGANTKVPGYHGEVRTDAIMLCYAAEVNRLFLADKAAGRTTVVTDGGVVKEGCERMPLAEALGDCWPENRYKQPPVIPPWRAVPLAREVHKHRLLTGAGRL